MSAVFSLDKARVRRSFAAACQSYDGVADLQRTVGRRLLEAGQGMGIAGTVLDLGCGTGFLTGELLRYPAIERMIALDIALPMLQRTRHKLGGADVDYVCADAERLALLPDSIDRIFSNLALQWCRDLAAVFDGCHKALKPGGGMTVSTFGPQTLNELKQAWQRVDDYRHVNEFYGTDELYQFLLAAGFTRIQMVSRCYYSEYASVWALMQELKGIGAHNVANGRNKKITTKTQMQTMISAYPVNQDDRILATFEVITFRARR